MLSCIPPVVCFWVILLLCQIVLDIVWYKCFSDVTMVTWCHISTIWHHNSSIMEPVNRKYTWLHFLLLHPSGYSIWGTMNCQITSSTGNTRASILVTTKTYGQVWKVDTAMVIWSLALQIFLWAYLCSQYVEELKYKGFAWLFSWMGIKNTIKTANYLN